MFARSNTITGADPQRMDAGIAMVRDEVMPAVTGMAGCIGLSMLVDREAGRAIVTSAWESEESMRATAGGVEPMRRRVMDVMNGRLDVQEWEIALMHRRYAPGDDACARVTWVRCDPAEMESMIDGFRMTQTAVMDDMAGFCSLSMVVDRSAGRSSVTSVWKDRAAMDATRDRIMGMRDEFTARTGMQVEDVAEFEVTIHHLRVPEMA